MSASITPSSPARRSSRATDPSGRRDEQGATTADRILDAALVSFATKGYEASSLDALAAGLDVRKQTILYWFSSKEQLLEAVIDRSAVELAGALQDALTRAGDGWDRIEAVVRSVFKLAARRPELLGLVRELGRLGGPAATRLVTALEPLVARATAFLETEMDSGPLRRQDPRLLLLTIYSSVTGILTEVEVLRVFGEEPTVRSLVRRRNEILAFLHSALVITPD